MGKAPQSLWSASAPLPSFPSLDGDIQTDVLIIGGGMAGLLTAYLLHQQGVDYLLVEKGHIAGGNTQNTTAKITVQHGLIYRKLMKSGGLPLARGYWQAQQAAFDKLSGLCREVDCDYQVKDNVVYSVDDPAAIREELAALSAIGCPAEYCKTLPLPLDTVGGVKVPRQAQFHPLKLLSHIVKGLNIREHTLVREMVGTTAVTDGGRIRAKKVIVATHFPFINKHGGYFLKLYQHRSYVLALRPAADVGGMYVDEKDTGLSFRNYKDYLLLGGGDHRTGKSGGNWAELRSFAGKHFPGAREAYFWATQDCMSLDGVPYIGRYAPSTPDFYVATGFNKWGMTGSMTAAMLLYDQVLGRENEFAEIFRPNRSIWKPQLFVNGLESAVNLLTPSKKRCPHLGCALKWNPTEHSWDCPCHGSRFSSSGTLLDNPANGDLP